MERFQVGEVIVQRFPVTERFARGDLSEKFDKLTVDDVITIDHAQHTGNEDKAHLLLSGDISTGDHYVRIKNSSGTLLNIDHNGKLHAISGLVAPELTAMSQAITSQSELIISNDTDIGTMFDLIAANQTELVATLETSEYLSSRVVDSEPATHEAIDNSLVQRDNTQGTTFTRIDLTNLLVEKQVALHKDAKLNYIPYHTVNGVSVPLGPLYQYRFGRAEEIGDGQMHTDGLEFLNPDPNEIKLQVNNTTPTIETVNTKDGDLYPWVRHRDSDRVSQVEIDSYGVHTRITNVTSIHNVTPGVVTVVPPGRGITEYVLHLSSAWIFANVAEHTIQITRTLVQEAFITAMVFIDNKDGAPAQNISSRAFLKRQMHFRNDTGHMIQRYVIGHFVANSEVSFPIGTKIVLRVKNNKLIS
jgi:hypothetical protein